MIPISFYTANNLFHYYEVLHTDTAALVARCLSSIDAENLRGHLTRGVTCGMFYVRLVFIIRRTRPRIDYKLTAVDNVSDQLKQFVKGDLAEPWRA